MPRNRNSGAERRRTQMAGFYWFLYQAALNNWEAYPSTDSRGGCLLLRRESVEVHIYIRTRNDGGNTGGAISMPRIPDAMQYLIVIVNPLDEEPECFVVSRDEVVAGLNAEQFLPREIYRARGESGLDRLEERLPQRPRRSGHLLFSFDDVDDD